MMNPKDKINKLLALANDKAATPAEKETALSMAKKLADKYGMRIEHAESASFSHSEHKHSTSYTERTEFEYKWTRIMNEMFEAYSFYNKTISRYRKSARSKYGYKFAAEVTPTQKTMLDEQYENIKAAYNLAKKNTSLKGKEFDSGFFIFFSQGFRCVQIEISSKAWSIAYKAGKRFNDACEANK